VLRYFSKKVHDLVLTFLDRNQKYQSCPIFPLAASCGALGLLSYHFFPLSFFLKENPCLSRLRCFFWRKRKEVITDKMAAEVRGESYCFWRRMRVILFLVIVNRQANSSTAKMRKISPGTFQMNILVKFRSGF